MSQRDANRKTMPTVTAFVDAMRAEFGADQVKVFYAREGGVELGKMPDLFNPNEYPAPRWMSDAPRDPLG